MENRRKHRLQTTAFLASIAFATFSFGENQPPYSFLNFSDELIQALEIKEDFGIDRAATALHASVIAPNNRLYEQLSGTFDHGRLKRYLDRQAPSLSRTAEVSFSINRDKISQYWGEFTALFPELKGDIVSILCIPSFGSFEAQSRPVGDEYSLLIGIDEIASRTGGRIDSVLLHHELFHIYHYQSNSYIDSGARSFFEKGQLPEIYNLLWVEGLATYASRILNPDASNRDIFFSETLYDETEVRLQSLVKRLSEKLTSNSFEDISGFFYFSGENKQIPKDCGYVIGERIVIEAAKRHTLEKLTVMKGEGILEEVQLAIQSLMRMESTANQSAHTTPASASR